MKRLLGGIFVTFLIVLGAAAPLRAQAGATAQISGSVRDESGGVLPGATVTITQTDTGLARDTVTDANGSYVLTNLPVGPYRMEVSLPGFKTYSQTGIVLQVNAAPVLNVVLSLGQLAETISVTGNTTLVETRTTSISQVVENQRILELPLNGRNAVDLVMLVPGTVGAGSSSSRSMQGGRLISVAGGQSAGVAYTLDGATHNNPYDNANLPLPFPDALQEFRIETSTLTAQHGMHSGAAATFVTKFGTNQRHGVLFEFLRTHDLNATNPFSATGSDGTRLDDALNRNQYGGVFGGPIQTDRIFYFVGYQGTNTRQTPSDTIRFIPTAQMLAGDFTTISSASCNNGRAIALRAPFAGNKISPALLDPVALKIVAKLPTTTDPCGRVNVPSPVQVDESQPIGKIDINLSASHSMFARYMATTYKTPPPFSLADNLLNTTTGGRDNLAQSFTYGDNYIFSSTTLNAFRLAFNRTAIHRTQQDYFSAPEVGINAYSYQPHYMQLSVSGGFSLGGGTENEATFHTDSYQVSDDLTLVRGPHQFVLGGSVAHWKNTSLANVRSAGIYSFDGSATGLALADFLTGKLTSLRQSAPNNLFMTQWYLGLYAQDTWTVGPKVTLNYGLRWEPWFPQQVTNDAIYMFDLARFQANQHSTVFPNAPAGFIYPGDSAFVNGQAGINKRWNNLAPRVGVAWDPAGDGKMSIRSSYGVAYDFVNAQYHLNTSNAPPWGFEQLITSPSGGFVNPYLGQPGGNPFPVSFDKNAPFSASGPFLAINPDMKTTTVQSYNLSVERQFLRNWLATASYVGRYTSHLWNMKAINPGQPTVTSVVRNGVRVTCTPSASNFQTCMNGILNQRRTLSLADPVNGQYIGFLDFHDDSGWERYNGMILSVERRSARGLSLNANYTLSRCVGLPSSQLPNPGTGWTAPDNPGFDKGYCDSDRRHIFNVSLGVWAPQVSGEGVVRALVTDWRVSGIFRAQSGSPLNIVAGTDRALTGNVGGNQRVNVVAGVEPIANASGLNYLAPAAFGLPAFGTLGNYERNSLYGPGRWQLDAVLARVFRLPGTQGLEFRLEAFNITNNFLRNNPGQSMASAATFGVINSAGDPRILQLGLKYTF